MLLVDLAGFEPAFHNHFHLLHTAITNTLFINISLDQQLLFHKSLFPAAMVAEEQMLVALDTVVHLVYLVFQILAGSAHAGVQEQLRVHADCSVHYGVVLVQTFSTFVRQSSPFNTDIAHLVFVASTRTS